MANKKFDLSKLTFPLMGLLIVFGVLVFLVSKSDGTSGFDALKMQNTSFWVWAIIGLIAAAGLVYFAVKNEAEGGGSKKTMLFAVLALILLTAPWGKACSSKADPVTAPGYENPAP